MATIFSSKNEEISTVRQQFKLIKVVHFIYNNIKLRKAVIAIECQAGLEYYWTKTQ